MQQQQGPLPPLTGYSAVQPVTQAPLGSLPYNPGNAAAETIAYSAADGGGVTPNYAFNGAPAAGQVLPNYGMDYLALLDQIIVKQQIEPLEMLGIEMNNTYKIFNSLGQQIFMATEDTDMWQRMFCGPGRGFLIKITNNNNQEVFRLIREFKCCGGCACIDGLAFEVYIQTPDGQPLGMVKQEASCDPRFSLRDASGQIIAEINVNGCDGCTKMCSGREFPITTPDRSTEIGRITKKWSGALREMLTDADGFTVSFPINMDPKVKSIFIGALFLLDFMYFEKQK